ncbi:hypothetical protein BDN70DRAFT_884800 [Pholiota conissans]|uniref:FTP domain-containing protein n=1 Tax=Pholiota conissans TaxID=109636 RepID=A0A9P6CV40_9AGAR|nr:hypothetical protein BDN70DRAFT_884800 [Pholiota conissans]
MYFISGLALPIILASSGALAAVTPVQRSALDLPELTLRGEIMSFDSSAVFKRHAAGSPAPLASRAAFNLKDASVAFATTLLPPNVNGGGVAYQSGYVDNGVQSASLIQTHNSVPITNAIANVNFNMAGQVTSYTCAFVNPTTFMNSVPNVTPQSFLPQVEAALNATYTASPTNQMTLQYFVKDNTANLAYVFQVENASTGAAYEVYVDSVTRQILSAVSL